MKKRTLALMLSAALCVGLLAGCGSGNNDSANTPAAGGSETPSQESTAAPVSYTHLSYHILSPFATETRKKPLTVISIWCYYSLVTEHKFYFIRSVSPFGDPRCEKMPRRLARHFLVEEGGFEPPKRIATDLQSAPFGHSGTPPYELVGAGGRTRTPDRLITNQLLYQLSYTSIPARPQRRLV